MRCRRGLTNGDVDQGLGDIETLLEVRDEPSPPNEPAERSLDHPSAWQQLGLGLAVHRLTISTPRVEERRLNEQLGAVIGAVGEQMLDSRPQLADRSQDRLSAGAVGDLRRGQVATSKRPSTSTAVQRLRPPIFSLVSLRRVRGRCLEPLTVDDGGRRSRLASDKLAVDYQSRIMDRAEQQQPEVASVLVVEIWVREECSGGGHRIGWLRWSCELQP